MQSTQPHKGKERCHQGQQQHSLLIQGSLDDIQMSNLSYMLFQGEFDLSQ